MAQLPSAFDCKEQDWDSDDDGYESYGEAAADATTALAQLLALSWTQRLQGREFYLKHPVAKLTLQVSAPQYDCKVCGGREHGWLIVQQIEVKEKKKGHGTAIVNQLMDACAKHDMGVLLQSCITKGSKKLAAKMELTQRNPTSADFFGCRIERQEK